MTRQEAIKAANTGAIAACISAAMTVALCLYALVREAEGGDSWWGSPIHLLDALFIFGCAYGVYKKSRLAAVLVLVSFVLSKALIAVETGNMPGAGIAIVLSYFFVRAVQGVFVFHKIERAENPNYKPVSKRFYFIAAPIGALLVLLMGAGFMATVGVIPSSTVQTGAQMFQKDRDTLIEHNIVASDDQILFFYAAGLISILEHGNVLTDDRVIYYFTDDEKELKIYELYFEEIASVELVSKGNLIENSLYRVHATMQGWLSLLLSTENQGDELFVRELEQRIKGSR